MRADNSRPGWFSGLSGSVAGHHSDPSIAFAADQACNGASGAELQRRYLPVRCSKATRQRRQRSISTTNAIIHSEFQGLGWRTPQWRGVLKWTASMDANAPRARILVVDDEDSIRDLLMTALRFTGFSVDLAGSGKEALRAVPAIHPDLVVLDVNLPDVNGFDVCRRLRASGEHCPVIFLTARDEPHDLRAGFVEGGDDYLTKPFSLEELVLRIEAVLRRTKRGDEVASRLVAGELVLDEVAHQVWNRGEEIALSPTEYRLLRYLLLNRDRVLSKRQLLDHVWDDAAAGELSAVETYVSYLRRKIDDRDGRLIQTVRGFGYALRTPAVAKPR